MSDMKTNGHVPLDEVHPWPGYANGRSRRISFEELLADRNRLAKEKTRLETLHFHALRLLFDALTEQMRQEGKIEKLTAFAREQGLTESSAALSQALTDVVSGMIETGERPADPVQAVASAIRRLARSGEAKAAPAVTTGLPSRSATP